MLKTLCVCLILISSSFGKELKNGNLHNGKFFIYDRVDRDMDESSIDEMTSDGPESPAFFSKVKPPESFKYALEYKVYQPNSQVNDLKNSEQSMKTSEFEPLNQVLTSPELNKFDQGAKPILAENFNQAVKPSVMNYHTQENRQIQKPFKNLKESRHKIFKPFDRKMMKEEIYNFKKLKKMFQQPKSYETPMLMHMPMPMPMPLPMQMQMSKLKNPFPNLSSKMDHLHLPTPNFYNKKQMVPLFPLRPIDSNSYPISSRDNHKKNTISENYAPSKPFHESVQDHSDLSSNQRDTLLQIFDSYYQLINRFNINFAKILAESQEREMKAFNNTMLLEPTIGSTHNIPMIF